MEGDGPTCCMVLHEYCELKTSLEDRLDGLMDDDHMYPMIHEMLRRTNKYLNEAASCDSLVLATIFHPSFRLGFFSLSFEDHSGMNDRADELLRTRYTERQKERSRKAISSSASDNDDIIIVSDPSVKTKLPKVFQLYKHANTSSDLGELDRYLQGLDPLDYDDPSELLNPQCALDWWSVSNLLL